MKDSFDCEAGNACQAKSKNPVNEAKNVRHISKTVLIY